MNIKSLRNRGQQGGALLTTLVICSVLGASTLGYLSLIEHESKMSARSQTWNLAMAVVEAGVEEGLEQLNANTNNLTADGWTANGTIYTSPTREFADGSRYVVTIDMADTSSPIIEARGYVFPPTFGLINRNAPFFAAAGMDNVTGSSSMIARAVRVRCSRGNLFTASLVAKHTIDLKGNGVYTDSYDSGDPTKSSSGIYNKSFYSGDEGDIACNGGLVNDSISIGNANIYGKVHAGPGVPVTIGPNGGVGTHDWQKSNTGFEDGYVLHDANFNYPDTSLPDTSGYSSPRSGWVYTTVGGILSSNYYKYILDANGKYTADALSDGKTLINGANVTLVMKNGLTGSEDFTIPEGNNVLVYSGGSSVTVSGNQVLNPNGYAGSFIVYAAPSVTSVTFNGNGEFVGVLVAPNANLTMNGGGKSNNDFAGSVMVNSATMNGHFSFHYDESLKRGAALGRYLITSWDEIKP